MVLRFVVNVPTDNKESENTKHAHMKFKINENATKNKYKLETA
jgi:hypothetical protein